MRSTAEVRAWSIRRAGKIAAGGDSIVCGTAAQHIDIFADHYPATGSWLLGDESVGRRGVLSRDCILDLAPLGVVYPPTAHRGHLSRVIEDDLAGSINSFRPEGHPDTSVAGKIDAGARRKYLETFLPGPLHKEVIAFT